MTLFRAAWLMGFSLGTWTQCLDAPPFSPPCCLGWLSWKAQASRNYLLWTVLIAKSRISSVHCLFREERRFDRLICGLRRFVWWNEAWRIKTKLKSEKYDYSCRKMRKRWAGYVCDISSSNQTDQLMKDSDFGAAEDFKRMSGLITAKGFISGVERTFASLTFRTCRRAD